MSITRRITLTGVSLALVAGAPAAALAAGTTVSVRVEGINRTLLPTKVVHTHPGSITKGGAPAGTCPATTAAGALNVATAGHWSGTYGTYGLSVTQIFGEAHVFKASAPFWSIWVDNKFAPAGICGLTLHRGEQLLFAAVPARGTVYPLVLTGPRRATTGHRFTLKLTYFKGQGRARPVAGATVRGAGLARARTSAAGTVSVTPTRAGKLTYRAAKTGYIRSAAATVRVG